MPGGARRAAKRYAVPEESPGLLGNGASSAAAAIAGVGWVAGADLVSGATLWKLGSRMLEYHERPRSDHGKHRH